MNWLKKIRENINRKKKANEEETELKKSNYGRSFGWIIELNGKAIGELIDNVFYDMFWVKYKIIAYKGFEEMLFDHKKWAKCKFEFRNKHYAKYVNAVCGPSIERENGDYTIIMRGLYLTSLQKESHQTKKNEN